MQLDDLRRRMGRAEDSLSGVLPKLSRIETRQDAMKTEQDRQGVVLDDLHEEAVGERAVKGWRRNLLAWAVGLASLISVGVAIAAVWASRG